MVKVKLQQLNNSVFFVVETFNLSEAGFLNDNWVKTGAFLLLPCRAPADYDFVITHFLQNDIFVSATFVNKITCAFEAFISEVPKVGYMDPRVASTDAR